eukprot:gene10403-7262_t
MERSSEALEKVKEPGPIAAARLFFTITLKMPIITVGVGMAGVEGPRRNLRGGATETEQNFPKRIGANGGASCELQ